MSWLRETLSSSVTGRLSSKRHIAFFAAIALIGISLGIGIVCIGWISSHGDLGTGAATVCTCIFGILSTLAGVVYYKPEVKP